MAMVKWTHVHRPGAGQPVMQATAHCSRCSTTWLQVDGVAICPMCSRMATSLDGLEVAEGYYTPEEMKALRERATEQALRLQRENEALQVAAKEAARRYAQRKKATRMTVGQLREALAALDPNLIVHAWNDEYSNDNCVRSFFVGEDGLYLDNEPPKEV